MKNKVSRIAIICALEETIRDEVKRMCDTDSLAELDTMALHAKGNIKMLQSVKYKSLVKESVEVVKDLVKDEPQTDCQDCKYAWWNGDAKRYECTVERCQYEDEPQTCSVSGRPYSECASDEPQKIMEKCYSCKWWNYSYGCSNKKGICEFEPLKDEQSGKE